jgi:hypothetical protein
MSNKTSNKINKPLPTESELSLQGYSLIEQSQWDKIPYKTYIKYLRNDGVMRKGGFVKSIVHTLDKNNNDTIRFELVSNFSSNATTWQLYAGNIKKIWKKEGQTYIPDENVYDPRLIQPNQVNLTNQVNQIDITEIKEDIEFCKKTIDLLKKETQKNTNDISRMVNVIRELMNK